MQALDGRQVTLYAHDAGQEDDLDIKLATLEAEDGARVEGLLWFRAGTKPTTAILTMHPANNVMQNYATGPLARQGFAVLKASTRYAGDDGTLVFENTLLDIAGAIRWLRAEGFERVALFGHSGGASMMAYYQSQAESPNVTCTPAGDPPNLTEADLPAADALIVSNPHPGRHITQTLGLDPSVVNEDDPITADPGLNMFNPQNGPPYTTEWLERYRAAQVARNRRITLWCRSKLKELDAIGHDVVRDLPFIDYRTVADPSFLDSSIEPSDRPPGESLWGDPYTLNYYAPAAHSGRVSTLRSWLSQFGLETSHCELQRHVARVNAPTLFIQGTADAHITTIKQAYEVSPYRAKELIYVKGATHLFKGQPELQEQFMGKVADWLRRTGLG